MFCRRCGKEVAADAAFCPSCGMKIYVTHQEVVKTYLPEAIIITILCCLPLGIPAIVYAANVSSRLSAQDVDGAKAASAKARVWCIAALSVGLGIWTLSLLNALCSNVSSY